MLMKHKNRSFRRVIRKLASRVTVHYKKRNPKQAHCGNCGSVLQAVPRGRPYKMQNMAKTKKRPERPYGGVLCSKCLRTEMKAKARSL
jgi:large subunit ribosomal protein L34e